MGIFNSLFKSQKEVSPAQVLPITRLDSWLKEQYQDLLSHTKLGEESLRYIEKLKEQRWLLECKLDEWQKLLPKEKRTEVETIFNNTRVVLDLLTFSANDPVERIFSLHKKFAVKLIYLIKSIEGTSFAHNFSFLPVEDQEPNPLLEELQLFRELAHHFEQKLNLSGLRTLENLSDKQVQFLNYTQTISSLRKQKQDLLFRFNASEERRKEKELELEELKAKPGFSEVYGGEKQRKVLQQQLQEHQEQVYAFFSPLLPLFKEYLKAMDNGLLSAYVHDPLAAFARDEELKIIPVLQEVKEAMEKGYVPIPLAQAQFYFGFIEQAQGGYLKPLQRRQKTLLQESSQVQIPSHNKLIAHKLQEAQYRFDHFAQQAQLGKERLSALDEEIKEAGDQRNREVELFCNMVKVSLGKEIVLHF